MSTDTIDDGEEEPNVSRRELVGGTASAAAFGVTGLAITGNASASTCENIRGPSECDDDDCAGCSDDPGCCCAQVDSGGHQRPPRCYCACACDCEGGW